MLKAKNCLQIQSRTKYLQQTLLSSEIGHYEGGGVSVSIFQTSFARIKKKIHFEKKNGH